MRRLPSCGCTSPVGPDVAAGRVAPGLGLRVVLLAVLLLPPASRAATPAPVPTAVSVGAGVASTVDDTAVRPTRWAAAWADLWAAVLAHDPQARLLHAEAEAAATLPAQARGLWAPQVQLSAGGAWASRHQHMGGARFAAPGLGSVSAASFDARADGALALDAAVQLRQPVRDPQREADARALQLQAAHGEAARQAALQALLLRTAERWQALRLAEADLRLQRQLLQALSEAEAQAAERYRLGASPITGWHEAVSRRAAQQASSLRAEAVRQLALQVLADSSGWDGGALEPLAIAGQAALLPDVTPAQEPAPSLQGLNPALDRALAPASSQASSQTDPAGWRARAERLSPRLQQARLAVEAAELQRARSGRDRQWRVDLVAGVSRQQLAPWGGAVAGEGRLAATDRAVGVQAVWLWDAGGGSDARQAQAVAGAAAAAAAFEAERQQIGQQLQARWLAWRSAGERLQALQVARQAAAERLAATRLGRELGDRQTLDVLDAEAERAALELQWLHTRAERWLDGLRLQALSGGLDPAVLGAALVDMP